MRSSLSAICWNIRWFYSQTSVPYITINSKGGFDHLPSDWAHSATHWIATSWQVDSTPWHSHISDEPREDGLYHSALFHFTPPYFRVLITWSITRVGAATLDWRLAAIATILIGDVSRIWIFHLSTCNPTIWAEQRCVTFGAITQCRIQSVLRGCNYGRYNIPMFTINSYAQSSSLSTTMKSLSTSNVRVGCYLHIQSNIELCWIGTSHELHNHTPVISTRCRERCFLHLRHARCDYCMCFVYHSCTRNLNSFVGATHNLNSLVGADVAWSKPAWHSILN